MSARARTPPPPAGGVGQQLQLTPEQVRRFEENRLRAKAKLQERERLQRQHAATSSAQHANANGKRPLTVVSADSTSPTAPGRRHEPSLARTAAVSNASNALQGALHAGPSNNQLNQKHFAGADGKGGGPDNAPLKSMIGQYVEYDLSTLKNSRGGFLLESEEDDPKRLRERQMQEELRLKRLENARLQGQLRGAAMSLDPSENPTCVHCGSTDLDDQLRAVFGAMCCTNCKKERPEMYSLLTKTECKEDYLLTEPELRDTELMPHLLRPNPHRPTYSNMMLFLRCQVEAFAFSDAKWGSPEALDAEFERREAEKKDKKSKKFAKKLSDLRKKTRTNVWHRRQEAEHKHEFEQVAATDGSGGTIQRCAECGFQIDVESF